MHAYIRTFKSNSDHVPYESVAVVINVVQVEQQCVGWRQRYRTTNTRCRRVNFNVNICANEYDVPDSRCSCNFNLIIGRCCDGICGIVDIGSYVTSRSSRLVINTGHQSCSTTRHSSYRPGTAESCNCSHCING